MRRLVVLLVVVVLLSAVALVASRPESALSPETAGTADRVEVTTSSPVRPRRPRGGAETDEPEPESTATDFDREHEITSGRVVWPDGSPAVDAHVVLGDLDDSQEVTRTDERGEFGFATIAHDSNVTALAHRAGAQWRASAGMDGWRVRTTLRLQRSPASETVRIVRVHSHDGEAIHGAQVQVVAGTPGTRTRDGSVPAMQAAGGEFIIVPEHWDPFDPLHLIVHSATDAEGEPLPYGAALVEVDPWSRNTTEVFLPPGRPISGRVLSPDGRPVAGADVHLHPPYIDGYDGDHMERFGLATTTDAAGRYTYHGVNHGTCRLSVSSEPGVHAGSALVRVADGERPPELVVRPEITASIRVTAPDGTPLADARAFGVGGRRLPADAAGVIRLEHLVPDDTVFCGVTAPGHATEWVRDWAPQDGDVRNVVLHPARSIRGTVLGPEGAALRDLTLLADGAPSGLQPRWDERGFLLRRVPASAFIRIGIHLDHDDTAWTPVPSGADDLTLVLPPTRGFVLYVAGAPDHPVSIRGPDGELARRDRWGSLLDFDSDGWPETVDVIIGPGDDGTVALARDLSATGFHRLALKQGLAFGLSLDVPDDVDARLAHAWFVHESDFEFALDVRSAYRHEALGLPPGDYELHVRPPGSRPTIVRRIHLDTDDELELELR